MKNRKYATSIWSRWVWLLWCRRTKDERDKEFPLVAHNWRGTSSIIKQNAGLHFIYMGPFGVQHKHLWIVLCRTLIGANLMAT
jgi:hypothetical protein